MGSRGGGEGGGGERRGGAGSGKRGGGRGGYAVAIWSVTSTVYGNMLVFVHEGHEAL